MLKVSGVAAVSRRGLRLPFDVPFALHITNAKRTRLDAAANFRQSSGCIEIKFCSSYIHIVSQVRGFRFPSRDRRGSDTKGFVVSSRVIKAGTSYEFFFRRFLFSGTIVALRVERERKFGIGSLLGYVLVLYAGPCVRERLEDLKLTKGLTGHVIPKFPLQMFDYGFISLIIAFAICDMLMSY